MDYSTKLPITGGVAVGGLVVGQAYVVAIALGVLIAAAVVIRFGFRRRKEIASR